MPSRQDQLHSYQFMVQRVVAALVMRETDPAASPFRRAAGASLASVLIAAIVFGAVAVYGAIVGGGSTDWRDPAAVIVEKESGARYVYRDGRLHPVLNYASALLIAGSADPRTVLVSRESIAGVTRGEPLGLADAPDSLPAADRLSNAPWTVCSVIRPDRGGRSGRSVLLVGSVVEDGGLLGDDAVLAEHPDGSLHLIWHNRRHLIRDRELVLPALNWIAAPRVPVAPALLNALPAGADLARVPIVDRGQRSAKVPDARIGEVFVVESLTGERQYVVAKRDGLAGITQLQASLLLVQAGQDAPTPLSQGRFASLPSLPDLVPDDAAAPPAATPTLTPAAGDAICAQVRDDTGVSEVRVDARIPDLTNLPRTAGQSASGGVLADHVLVEPGRAALVEAAAAPGATGGTICVVTDLGRRYPVTGSDALSMLGYGAVAPLRLPAGLVMLVPAGQALDPAAARTPVVRQ